MITSLPIELGNPSTKSILISVQMRSGIGKGCRRPAGCRGGCPYTASKGLSLVEVWVEVKKTLGNQIRPNPQLPEVTTEGTLAPAPDRVLQRR
jgi:hypothetical protein